MPGGLRSLFFENSDDDIAGSKKSGANCQTSAGLAALFAQKMMTMLPANENAEQIAKYLWGLAQVSPAKT